MNSSKKVLLVALVLSAFPAQLWAQQGGRMGGGGMGRPGGPGGMGGPGMGMRRSPKGKLDRTIMGMGRLDNGGTALSKAQAKRVIMTIMPWRSKTTMTDAQATALTTKLEGVLTVAQKTQLSNRPGGGPGEGRGGEGRGGEGRGGEGRGGDRGGRGGGWGGGRGGDRGGPGGPPPGGMGGGPGGPGGPGGMSAADMKKMQASMATMRKLMDTYNPLYSGTYPQVKQLPDRMQEGFTRRHDRLQEVIAGIKKRAA